VKFLLQYSVHDAMQSTTRQETSQTRAGRPRHQSNLELSHGPGNASSKFARRTRFDKLSPEPLIDPRQPGWCGVPHTSRRNWFRAGTRRNREIGDSPAGVSIPRNAWPMRAWSGDRRRKQWTS